MAAQEQVLEGSLPVAELARLCELLADDSGDVHLNIVFSRGHLNRTKLSGTVTATVCLTCQNCLQDYETELESDLAITIVRDQQALDDLDDDIDGYVCETPQLSVRELLEDELLLSVPMIPRHGSDCPGDAGRQGDETPSTAAESVESAGQSEKGDTHRPFAGLAEALKQQNDDN